MFLKTYRKSKFIYKLLTNNPCSCKLKVHFKSM